LDEELSEHDVILIHLSSESLWVLSAS
jgi:hypothetical protein